MDVLASLVSYLYPVLPAVILVLGLMTMWHGLRGQPDGEGGLLRRHTTLLGRLEGFRRVLLAIVLIGFGLGWLLESRLLIFLALGFGFAELRESTLIIDAFRLRPKPAIAPPRHPRSAATT